VCQRLNKLSLAVIVGADQHRRYTDRQFPIQERDPGRPAVPGYRRAGVDLRLRRLHRQRCRELHRAGDYAGGTWCSRHQIQRANEGCKCRLRCRRRNNLRGYGRRRMAGRLVQRCRGDFAEASGGGQRIPAWHPVRNRSVHNRRRLLWFRLAGRGGTDRGVAAPSKRLRCRWPMADHTGASGQLGIHLWHASLG
jgi:hypothetical protein